MYRKFLQIILLSVLFTTVVSAQQSIYTPYEKSDVAFEPENFGRMWTFDNFPFGMINETYGTSLNEEWLDDIRLSALQFANGCSGSFVSEDGLIMTNHHCARDGMVSVEKEGEDLLKTGFYAESPEEERKIPNLFVDRLELMKDVTTEVNNAAANAENDNQIIELKNEKIKEIENSMSEETGLVCKVVSLYNGSKLVLYGYKRFNDIRLVMSPEFQIASTGWDWDNFTYPRYELDFMFFRAYENDKPVKVNNYFEWSDNGATDEEPIFVVGRPGNTDRQLSSAEWKYYRDTRFKAILLLYNNLYNIYRELYDKYPERESELLNQVMSLGNARKVYAGRIQGLSDENLLSVKEDFENKLKSQIDADSALSAKYGDLFPAIDNVIEELRGYYPEDWGYRLFRNMNPVWFEYAQTVINIARQKKLPESERKEGFSDKEIEEMINSLAEQEIDEEFNHLLLEGHADYLYYTLGKDHPVYKNLYGGIKGYDAAEYALGHSYLSTPDNIRSFAGDESDVILSEKDPFVNFTLKSEKMSKENGEKIKEAFNTLQVLNGRLGQLISDVYSEQLPPDATLTLRITDGKIKGYEYNGTIAPGHTTFFGMFDRFNSFNGKTYPWGLPEKWKNIPEDFDLSTPLNIASTNDIVGGNSGSAVVNANGEVVGLTFDGNMESLWGDYLFLPSKNRAISVDSRGLISALEHVYKSDRLVKELKEGKMVK